MDVSESLIETVYRLRAALEKLDMYIDFSEPLENGDWGIEDVSGINAVFSEVRELLDNEALSTTTEPFGPYTIRRDECGQVVAIERNEMEVERIVARLNGTTEPTGAERVREPVGTMKIFNRDGSVTEVTPNRLWTPDKDVSQ